ncbi:MAG: hypothetical protein H7Y60_07400 [Rhodospirillaceae bacterium]|nr:hypothetical protein [Rhodospirillales bacterium]
MHIYSDESGGSDRACQEFVVSAVLIAPEAAARVVRQFRKRAQPRIIGEIKGHQLSPMQRALFFRLLCETGMTVAVAAVSRRSDAVGGWAMRHLPEHELWRELAVEAIGALPAGKAIGVTVDRGRYSKETLTRCCHEIAGRVETLGGAAIRIGGSEVTAGLQVADVIANTVYHLNADGRDGPLARELIAVAGIRVLTLSMAERAPGWLQPIPA